MKTIIKTPKAPTNKVITYPILMENVDKDYPINPGDNTLLVLFTDEHTGIRIRNSRHTNNVIDYKSENNWYPADDASVWRPFDGSVTISN